MLDTTSHLLTKRAYQLRSYVSFYQTSTSYTDMNLVVFSSDLSDQLFKGLEVYSDNEFYIHICHESNFEAAIFLIFIRL